jgi:hypothetical protein
MGVTLVVPDVAAVVSKAAAMGGKVVKDTASYEYPATQIPDQVRVGDEWR